VLYSCYLKAQKRRWFHLFSWLILWILESISSWQGGEVGEFSPPLVLHKVTSAEAAMSSKRKGLARYRIA
jgi:hypothetical protein